MNVSGLISAILSVSIVIISLLCERFLTYYSLTVSTVTLLQQLHVEVKAKAIKIDVIKKRELIFFLSFFSFVKYL